MKALLTQSITPLQQDTGSDRTDNGKEALYTKLLI
jgi:hypothetical protein